jgi:hypothetical protein
LVPPFSGEERHWLHCSRLPQTIPVVLITSAVCVLTRWWRVQQDACVFFSLWYILSEEKMRGSSREERSVSHVLWSQTLISSLPSPQTVF